MKYDIIYADVKVVHYKSTCEICGTEKEERVSKNYFTYNMPKMEQLNPFCNDCLTHAQTIQFDFTTQYIYLSIKGKSYKFRGAKTLFDDFLKSYRTKIAKYRGKK